MKSTKEIGEMIDKLEHDTEVVKQKLKPNSVEEGCAVGLAIALVIWIVITLIVTKALGVW